LPFLPEADPAACRVFLFTVFAAGLLKPVAVVQKMNAAQRNSAPAMSPGLYLVG
jgi:hypothetical protein